MQNPAVHKVKYYQWRGPAYCNGSKALLDKGKKVSEDLRFISVNVNETSDKSSMKNS